MAVSRDLVVVAVLHTLLMSAATAGALWWLSRSLRLWVWFAPLPLLSPYFWFYARVLWDNPFLIPLGALAHGRICRASRVGIIGGTAGLDRRDADDSARASDGHRARRAAGRAHAAGAWTRAVGAQVQCRRDCGRGAAARAEPTGSTSPRRIRRRPAADHRSPAGSFHWSAGGCSVRRGWITSTAPGPVERRDFRSRGGLSSLAYVLVWGGIAVAVFYCRSRPCARATWSPRAHVAAIAVGTLACQALIDGISGKYRSPALPERDLDLVRAAGMAGGRCRPSAAGLTRGRRPSATGAAGGLAARLRRRAAARTSPQRRHPRGLWTDARQSAAGRQGAGEVCARQRRAESGEHVRALSAHAGDPAAAERRPSRRSAPAHSANCDTCPTTRRPERSSWSSADA